MVIHRLDTLTPQIKKYTRRSRSYHVLITRRIAEYHGIIFLVPKYFFSITRSITENHGRQKFDNSLIRDKKENP